MLSALIFDVDGTLADTEHAHLAAFNAAFAAEGLGWQWDVPLYTELLTVSGGKERIRHYWQQVNGDVRDIDGTALDALIDHLHAVKTAAYEQAVRDGAVQLRPGVLELLETEDALAGGSKRNRADAEPDHACGPATDHQAGRAC